MLCTECKNAIPQTQSHQPNNTNSIISSLKVVKFVFCLDQDLTTTGRKNTKNISNCISLSISL